MGGLKRKLFWLEQQGMSVLDMVFAFTYEDI